MESFLSWLAGAVAVGTAALFAPKKKRKSAAKAESVAAHKMDEQSEVVIPIAKGQAKKEPKKPAKTTTTASEKRTRAASPRKSSAAKGKAAAKTKVKTPTAIRKPRKRKAS